MSARHGLLPVAAIALGLTACGSTSASAPISTTPPPAAPASAVAAPASAAPAERAPASARPAGTESPAGAGAGKCPSAKTLERLVDLPKGWHFVPSSVECWKGWATADPEGPSVGDGVYLFRYEAGTGWRFHSEGSGYHCRDLGIHEDAPFCQYP